MRAWLAVAIMLGLGMIQSVSAQTKLRFVFDKGSPPYSYATDGSSVAGLFPELVQAVFAALPEYSVSVEAYPWARAQDMVQKGEADGFLTYPSDGRKKYAIFNDTPAFIEDIGYLVFVPSNPNANALRKVSAFNDLRPFLFLGSKFSDWENDNVPPYIKRESIPQDESRLQVLIQRKHGDFIIMGRENCSYLLKKLGRQGDVEFAKVNFLPDSKVPFNFGVSQVRGDAAEIIKKLSNAMGMPKVKAELQRIQKRYQNVG